MPVHPRFTPSPDGGVRREDNNMQYTSDQAFNLFLNRLWDLSLEKLDFWADFLHRQAWAVVAQERVTRLFRRRESQAAGSDPKNCSFCSASSIVGFQPSSILDGRNRLGVSSIPMQRTFMPPSFDIQNKLIREKVLSFWFLEKESNRENKEKCLFSFHAFLFTAIKIGTPKNLAS